MSELSERELHERALALSQELIQRRQDDPLLGYEPTKKQQPFVDSILEGKTRFAGFFGANRSGKSDIGAYIGANLSRFGPKDAKALPHEGATIQVRDRATSGWVVSLDKNVSRDVIEPKYFDNGFVPPGARNPFIPKREIKEWRQQDRILKLKNGSIIGFKSCDAGEEKIQGAGKDWIHFDEEPPKPVFEEATIRVEAGRPLRIFMTCTLLPPIGQVGGVSWIYPEIIKPFQEGKRKDVMLFGASIYDNPYIGQAEIRALEALYPEGSPGRRIRLNGEWLPGIGGARTYSAFQSKVHVRKQPDPHPRRPLAFVWDFNVEPLITLVGQRDGDLHRVMRELVLEEGSIPEMCQLFYELYGDHHSEVWVYGDATGQGRTPQYSVSDYTVILQELRRYGMAVRLKIPPRNPLVQDRINAMNRIFKNEEGMSNIEIDDSCVELISDLEEVLLDPKGGIKKSHNKKDPYYRRTHSSDALGYWVTYERPVRLITNRREGVTIRDVSYAFRSK